MAPPMKHRPMKRWITVKMCTESSFVLVPRLTTVIGAWAYYPMLGEDRWQVLHVTAGQNLSMLVDVFTYREALQIVVKLDAAGVAPDGTDLAAPETTLLIEAIVAEVLGARS